MVRESQTAPPNSHSSRARWPSPNPLPQAGEGQFFSSSRLDQAVSQGEGGGGGAAFEAELSEDVGDVGHGGAVTDEERVADLAVGQTVDEQAQHIGLAAGQAGFRRGGFDRRGGLGGDLAGLG